MFRDCKLNSKVNADPKIIVGACMLEIAVKSLMVQLQYC